MFAILTAINQMGKYGDIYSAIFFFFFLLYSTSSHYDFQNANKASSQNNNLFHLYRLNVLLILKTKRAF